jgi:hypothetical protein
MQRVKSVQPLEGYRLAVCFEDGTTGEIALGDRLFGPVFEALKEVHLFDQVFVDEFGAIAWPNGADLAPDALYDGLRESAVAASAK